MRHPAEWLRAQRSGLVINDLGERVAKLLDEWQGGLYHLHAPFHKRTDWSSTHWIEIVEYGSLSTFDSDSLTRLVLLAHQHRLRVEVRGLANAYLSIAFSPRDADSSKICSYHPNLAEMLERQKVEL